VNFATQQSVSTLPDKFCRRELSYRRQALSALRTNRLVELASEVELSAFIHYRGALAPFNGKDSP